jgi:SagB-type dehydrogenase family enzyme
MTDKDTPIGDLYQQSSKYDREAMEHHPLDWSTKPSVFKQYTDAPTVKLPRIKDQGGPQLWNALRTRRSRRNYTEQPLSKEDLSQLLWTAQGVTSETHGLPLRTAPSAGGLYPIETYIVVNRVEGVEPGVYHYFPPDHTLERLREGDYSNAIAHAALDQRMAARAAVVLLWTAIVQRSRWKYRQRCYRYIFMDAGHIGQNIALAAEGMGLGSCAIGAFYDDEVNELVGADGEEETAVYLTSIGHFKH